MLITRRLEFDAGHRIPEHDSECRHLHGHRYAIEITLSGDVIEKKGAPQNGMVMDFAQVEEIARKYLVDAWDHAFIVYSGDTAVVNFLNSLPGHKTVSLRATPTAENMALEAFRILSNAYRDIYGNHLQLERVRLYETPNCWADAISKDLK
ncbi:MAG TPA: 6-carboxytetrahydropterin synthase QueD [Burkholderiales bacterium]|nr:6-carboxytetrahydropterin synthase QueD [Burkholderiales bacterium]